VIFLAVTSGKLKKKSELYFMSEIWGNILASRHKRASYQLNENPQEMPDAFNRLIENRHEAFNDLVVSVALQYADRVKLDFDCFLKITEE